MRLTGLALRTGPPAFCLTLIGLNLAYACLGNIFFAPRLIGFGTGRALPLPTYLGGATGFLATGFGFLTGSVQVGGTLLGGVIRPGGLPGRLSIIGFSFGTCFIGIRFGLGAGVGFGACFVFFGNTPPLPVRLEGGGVTFLRSCLITLFLNGKLYSFQKNHLNP